MHDCSFCALLDPDMPRTLLTVITALAVACDGGESSFDAQRVEGRTAAVANGASLYALRLWTAPELDSLHRAGVRVDSLDVEPDELRLRSGQHLPLADLVIVALDHAGRPVPAAPIVVETGSPVLSLTPESVIARAPGRTQLRVRSLLRNRAGASIVREVVVLVVR